MTASNDAKATNPEQVPLLSLTHFIDRLRTDTTRIWYVLVTALFVVLVATGVTTSSHGISNLRFDSTSESGLLFGEPLAIRSDEWMRSTPLRLGIMHTGDDEYSTPLTQDSGLVTGLQAGPAAFLVFFESTIARLGPYIPDRQLFALLWWLPYYGITLGVAYILRFFHVRPVIAIAAAALSVLSPAISWWALGAPFNVALAVGTAAFMVLAYQHAIGPKTLWRSIVMVGSILMSGVLLARMPLAYPPWSIPLGLLIVMPIAVALVWRRPHRVGLWIVGLVSLIAILLFADIVVQNYDAYAAVADTVYPGLRRSGGGGIPIAYFLSAHFSGPYLADGLELSGINQSEMATGLIALPVAALIYAVVSRARLDERTKPFVMFSAGSMLVLSAWVLLPWPAWSAQIPILNLLPPIRVAQIVGMGTVLLFAVVLNQVIDTRNRQVPFDAVVAILVALGMIYVGFALQASFLPKLTTMTIFITAIGLSVAVVASTYERSLLAGISALVAFSFLATLLTNPVMSGLGDLRGQGFETVRSMLNDAAGEGYLAADDMFMNSLTQAAGLKSLSGEQAAPSSSWLVLDPEAQYSSAWNRGAIVVFQWDPSLSSPVIETPQPDVLIVRTSPCDERLATLGLTAIVSVRPLDVPCLLPAGQFDWGQAPRWTYVVHG